MFPLGLGLNVKLVLRFSPRKKILNKMYKKKMIVYEGTAASLMWHWSLASSFSSLMFVWNKETMEAAQFHCSCVRCHGCFLTSNSISSNALLPIMRIGNYSWFVSSLTLLTLFPLFLTSAFKTPRWWRSGAPSCFLFSLAFWEKRQM